MAAKADALDGVAPCSTRLHTKRSRVAVGLVLRRDFGERLQWRLRRARSRALAESPDAAGGAPAQAQTRVAISERQALADEGRTRLVLLRSVHGNEHEAQCGLRHHGAISTNAEICCARRWRCLGPRGAHEASRVVVQVRPERDDGRRRDAAVTWAVGRAAFHLHAFLRWVFALAHAAVTLRRLTCHDRVGLLLPTVGWAKRHALPTMLALWCPQFTQLLRRVAARACRCRAEAFLRSAGNGPRSEERAADAEDYNQESEQQPVAVAIEAEPT
mmetsp:Transcript_3260/g.8434  ORF Transcript_3260/g.8434 Transcript_3260/m.8434 type:complete len:273 (-) Transcript_3260:216-1034(-)